MNMVAVIGIFVTLVTAIPVILQLRRHPRGLFILFFAEMWERFSYLRHARLADLLPDAALPLRRQIRQRHVTAPTARWSISCR